jgi:hypothetical protein
MGITERISENFINDGCSATLMLFNYRIKLQMDRREFAVDKLTTH